MISDAELEKLAKLSRLTIPAEDYEKYRTHFGKILGHMESLKALDLKDVEPMTTVDENVGILREDSELPGFDSERAFKNAPSMDSDHFTIPKVIH